MWRRYVDDELFNRNNPSMRQRTQRKQRRGEGEDGGGGGAQRRPRLPPQLVSDGGLDKAYQREYLAQGDAKRARRE